MSQLTSTLIDRVLCQIKGLKNLQHHPEAHEITFDLDLERMEQYYDFCYISGQMFHYAANHNDDLGGLHYDGMESPLAQMFLTMDNPLDPMERILVDDYFPLLMPDREFVQQASQSLLPKFNEYIKVKQREDQAKQKAEAEEARQKRLQLKAERKAAQQQAKNKSAKGNKGEIEPDPVVPATAKVQQAQVKEANKAENKTHVESNASYYSATAAQADAAKVPALEHRVSPWVTSFKEQLEQNRRYKGRDLKVTFIEGFYKDSTCFLWRLADLYRQLNAGVDEGLTDVMRDVIVYEYLGRLSMEQRLALGMRQNLASMGPENLYGRLRFSNVVIFPDGKSVFWYSLDAKGDLGNMGIDGFGIDIDPPYQKGYAVGIKHVYAGSFADHPTVRWYRELLSNEDLKQLVFNAHYCPCDNISPFSQDETGEEMTFVNDAFFVFELILPEVEAKEATDVAAAPFKLIEVLIQETPDITVADMISSLQDLRNQLSDFDQFVADIRDLVADAIVDMKNEQEARRRNRDPEYKTYTFTDPVHQNDFTRTKLKNNYPLIIERVVIKGNDLKFVMPSPLFSYVDSRDEEEQGEQPGLIHGDAIVVSLVAGDNGYDFSSLDIADCIQIPFGQHQNKDVEDYDKYDFYKLVEAWHEPLPEGWDQEWLQKAKELNVKREEAKLKRNAAKSKGKKKR